MTHTFRFTDEMEKALEKDKQILSAMTDMTVDDITDTAVINFCLRRIARDYNYFLELQND